MAMHDNSCTRGTTSVTVGGKAEEGESPKKIAIITEAHLALLAV